MSTGFLYDPAFLSHDTGPGHPERSDRLRAVMSVLPKQSWYGDLVQFKPHLPERKWIEQVHSSAYIKRAEEACRHELPYLDVADVAICRESYDIAMMASGAAIELGDAVVTGQVDNAFAAMRPPGHHAERDLALGFCLFNNVAVLARYLQKHHHLDKVLILDWDVHHGNGTQHTFEDDPSVMYVSTHQYPFYPGTGAASETGTGRGAGATVNCPMPAGSEDEDYETAWRERILPAVNDFAPDFVIISAGFDAHRRDPLAQVELSTGFYRWMTERMLEVADQHAGGRLVSLLEGGYDLQALAECVSVHVATLAGRKAAVAEAS